VRTFQFRSKDYKPEEVASILRPEKTVDIPEVDTVVVDVDRDSCSSMHNILAASVFRNWKDWVDRVWSVASVGRSDRSCSFEEVVVVRGIRPMVGRWGTSGCNRNNGDAIDEDERNVRRPRERSGRIQLP